MVYNNGTVRKVPAPSEIFGKDTVCRQHLEGGLFHWLAAIRTEPLQAAKRLRLAQPRSLHQDALRLFDELARLEGLLRFLEGEREMLGAARYLLEGAGLLDGQADHRAGG